MSDGVFGIDLGTTYSAIAFVDDTGRPSVVENQYGQNTTPSVVYFETESNVVVGNVAKESALISPSSVVSLVKRQMGNPDYSQTFFGKSYSAPGISALILKALAASAEADGTSVGKVVITVPAYFGMLEKEATRQAGQIAGLDVIGIVPEPVAAALAYGVGATTGDSTVIVYDLGGGTFDVTVMRLGDTRIEVLAVGGDHNLGGANWDQILFDHLVDEVVAQSGDDSVRDDEHAMQDIWNLAEKTKKELSSAESRNVILRSGGRPTKVTISRTQFEEMTANLVQETIEITERTLAEAEEKSPGVRNEISQMLLVGGSSLMPMVTKAIAKSFGWKTELADPHLAVAKGAALYAAGKFVRDIVDATTGSTGQDGERDSDAPAISLDDLTPEQEARIVEEAGGLPLAAAVELGNREVVNALPKAIGIKLLDTAVPGWDSADPAPHYVHHLVHAQTSLPHTPAEPFTAATAAANQDVIPIEIWEQAGATAGRALSENRFLKVGHIANLGSYSLPAESPVLIYLDVDAEGLVRVRAVEPKSGSQVSVEAKVQLLSDEQVRKEAANVAGLTAAT